MNDEANQEKGNGKKKKKGGEDTCGMACLICIASEDGVFSFFKWRGDYTGISATLCLFPLRKKESFHVWHFNSPLWIISCSIIGA